MSAAYPALLPYCPHSPIPSELASYGTTILVLTVTIRILFFHFGRQPRRCKTRRREKRMLALPVGRPTDLGAEKRKQVDGTNMVANIAGVFKHGDREGRDGVSRSRPESRGSQVHGKTISAKIAITTLRVIIVGCFNNTGSALVFWAAPRERGKQTVGHQTCVRQESSVIRHLRFHQRLPTPPHPLFTHYEIRCLLLLSPH